MASKQMLISCENIKKIEDYGTLLVCAMLSVASLESYETTTYQLGLFQNEEEETSKTICWELRRLMQLYTQQFKQIAERCELNKDTVVLALQKLMTEKRAKRKPRAKKTPPKEINTESDNADIA